MMELSVDNNNLAVNSFLKEVPIIENQFLYDTEYDRGLRHQRVNYFCKKNASRMFGKILKTHVRCVYSYNVTN